VEQAKVVDLPETTEFQSWIYDLEFSTHNQVSTVIGKYVFATRESMDLAKRKMDKLRPVSVSHLK
jgi:hypothetical protein